MIIDKLGAGHYQTREGDDVVILCLDAPREKPVIGYYVFEGKAYICTWSIAGVYSTGQEGPRSLDLISAPRKPREIYIAKCDVESEVPRAAYYLEPPIGASILFREVMEDEE